MLKETKLQNNVIIYQADNGAIELRGDADHDTIWATQEHIAILFSVQRPAITKHLQHIFESEELDEYSVCSKMERTATDGKTYQVQHYNLDAIISVGYRVNSKRATKFRRWATTVLRDHLTQGYTINRSQIGKHYDAFLEAVANLQAVLPEKSKIAHDDVLELVKAFSQTWMSLDAYDKDALRVSEGSSAAVSLTSDALLEAIGTLKATLIEKDEATELFAKERAQGSVKGIIGNIIQSFGGRDAYESIEEKAAHLLYFIVKNHPFVDGNKRSGAFAFI